MRNINQEHSRGRKGDLSLLDLIAVMFGADYKQ